MSHRIRCTWTLAVVLAASNAVAREKAPEKTDDPCAGRAEACEYYEAPTMVITRHYLAIPHESPAKRGPRQAAGKRWTGCSGRVEI